MWDFCLAVGRLCSIQICHNMTWRETNPSILSKHSVFTVIDSKLQATQTSIEKKSTQLSRFLNFSHSIFFRTYCASLDSLHNCISPLVAWRQADSDRWGCGPVGFHFHGSDLFRDLSLTSLPKTGPATSIQLRLLGQCMWFLAISLLAVVRVFFCLQVKLYEKEKQEVRRQEEEVGGSGQ